MPLILLALLLFVAIAFGGVVLLSLALRYRAGTSRRQGRRWFATLNMWLTSFSALCFLVFAFFTSFWIQGALQYALGGMAVGFFFGVLGLILTRWEHKPEGFFYTPSRWLALFITIVITARFAYAWWHATHPGSGTGVHPWLMNATFTQASLATAAGLIGYYLMFGVGVRFRLLSYERKRLL